MSRLGGKAYFHALREIVSRALNEADPLGLLRMGAPEDEYDPEVDTILPRLRGAASEADVRTILHEEFVRWFDESLAGAPEVYDGAARKIWAYLQAKGTG